MRISSRYMGCQSASGIGGDGRISSLECRCYSRIARRHFAITGQRARDIGIANGAEGQRTGASDQKSVISAGYDISRLSGRVDITSDDACGRAVAKLVVRDGFRRNRNGRDRIIIWSDLNITGPLVESPLIVRIDLWST